MSSEIAESISSTETEHSGASILPFRRETLGELNPRIFYLLQFENPPDILVLHCGGNGIGQIPLHNSTRQIRETILQLEKILPSTN